MNTRPIAIDLFAGAGGFSLGLEQAGFDVIAAVELDPIHCATHEYNFPHCATLCRDIARLTGAELRKLTGIGDRDIDCVAGGPPCQGFSLIGKRKANDPRSQLIFHFARLVAELSPKYFIMENVPGLSIGEQREKLTQLIDQFSKAGYEILEPKILNAADYGVPQNRRRLFLVGCKQGLSLPEWPLPKTGFLTVDDAIADLPEVELYPELLNRDWTEPDRWYTSGATYAAELRWGGWSRDRTDFSYPRQFSPTLLTGSQRSHHCPETVSRFAQTDWGKCEPVSHFHKLHPQKLCPTLRAGTGSDRGRHTAPRPIHPCSPRCITVREGARLHSFPDWFRFHATIWHGFRQIGNSVPPLLARAVASEVIRALGCTPLKPGKLLLLGSEELLNLTSTEAKCQQLCLF